MDFSWIGRRVPTPDFERIIAGALTDDVGQVGATASFWYPKRGAICRHCCGGSPGQKVASAHIAPGILLKSASVQSLPFVMSMNLSSLALVTALFLIPTAARGQTVARVNPSETESRSNALRTEDKDLLVAIKIERADAYDIPRQQQLLAARVKQCEGEISNHARRKCFPPLHVCKENQLGVRS